MRMIVLSLALSGVAALFELMTLGIRARGTGFVFAGPITLWMIPLSYACLMLPLGGFAAIASRWGAFWERLATTGLATVTVFSALFLFHPKVHLIAVAVLALGAGIQLARRLDVRSPSIYRTARIGATAVAVWIGVAALGERMSASMSSRVQVSSQGVDERPNVVLLILDTVRAASLSLYGNSRLTTPFLDAFAAHAVVFDEAISPAPWTLPAHASIFTGRAPSTMDVDWEYPLAGSMPTLAERFADAGYRTGGFVANVAYASAETGLSRGFSHYEDYVPTWGGLVTSSSLGRFFSNNPRVRQAFGYYNILGRRTAAQMNERALRWTRSESAAPYFLFVNYYDAHGPYLPAAPFDTLFGSTAGRDLSRIRQINAHIATLPHKSSMTAEQREIERLAYEQSIAWLDAEIGMLLDSLKVREQSGGRQTIVAVTADHGEQFNENGLYGHGNSLYLPALHVPLLIAGPGVPEKGSRRHDVVSTSDLGATLLSLAAVTETAGFGGHSLFAGLPSDLAVSSVRPARNQDQSYPSFRGKMYSATTSTWHLVRNADGTIEQFQRSTDSDSLATRARALGAIDAARSNEFDQTGDRGRLPGKR